MTARDYMREYNRLSTMARELPPESASEAHALHGEAQDALLSARLAHRSESASSACDLCDAPERRPARELNRVECNGELLVLCDPHLDAELENVTVLRSARA